MLPAPMRPEVTHRPLRFVAVGGWNALFGYAVMLVFTLVAEQLGGSWRWVVLPAQALAATNGFICQRLFVFPDVPVDLSTFFRYNVNTAGGVLLAVVEMYLLIDRLGLPSWAVQTAILPVNVVVLYLLHRHVTFITPRPNRY